MLVKGASGQQVITWTTTALGSSGPWEKTSMKFWLKFLLWNFWTCLQMVSYFIYASVCFQIRKFQTQLIWTDISSIEVNCSLEWMPEDRVGDRSILVQIMAWCPQATSHYLLKGRSRCMSPYGLSRPKCVKRFSMYPQHVYGSQWISAIFKRVSALYRWPTLATQDTFPGIYDSCG